MNDKKIQERFLTECNQAGAIAKFYGFQPIEAPEITKIDQNYIKNYDTNLDPEEVASMMRTYFEEKGYTLAQPAMFWTEKPFKGSNKNKKGQKLQCVLSSIGSNKAITDCLCMRAGLSILQQFGYKDSKLILNSIGDKESSSNFERKMSLFIKKNFNSFPADLRQILKKNIFALLTEEKKEWLSFREQCPKSLEFLSESSRAHFKEVLEFLEVMEIPYILDHSLIGDTAFCSETVFSFVSEKSLKDKLGYGFRTNRLAKKIGQKKDVPAVFLNIDIRIKSPLKKVKIKDKVPNFYLIQFGPEAKLKSLLVLEELRKAGQTVMHSIAKDKLGGQIGIAENLNIPYIILIGQKEALQNSVLFRNVATRAQEVVPIPELIDKIKKI